MPWDLLECVSPVSPCPFQDQLAPCPRQEEAAASDVTPGPDQVKQSQTANLSSKSPDTKEQLWNCHSCSHRQTKSSSLDQDGAAQSSCNISRSLFQGELCPENASKTPPIPPTPAQTHLQYPNSHETGFFTTPALQRAAGTTPVTPVSTAGALSHPAHQEPRPPGTFKTEKI